MATLRQLWTQRSRLGLYSSLSAHIRAFSTPCSNGVFSPHESLSKSQIRATLQKLTADELRFSPDDYNVFILQAGKKLSFRSSFEALKHMERSGISPTAHTYNALFDVCIEHRNPHAAFRLYKKMQTRDIAPDADSFRKLLLVSSHASSMRNALTIITDMESRYGIPRTTYDYNLVLNCCATLGKWRVAEDIMKRIQTDRLAPDVVTYNTRLKLCGKIKHRSAWKHARAVWDEMQHRGVSPDSTTFNSMVKICAQFRGLSGSALHWIKKMETFDVQPTVQTFVSLIRALGKDQKLDEITQIIDTLELSGIQPDVRLFNTAIDACRSSQNTTQALYYLHTMESTYNLTPTNATYSLILTACKNMYGVEKVRPLLSHIQSRGIKPDIRVYNAALQAYSATLKVEEAAELLSEIMLQGFEPTIQTYSALISVFGNSLDLSSAISVFRDIEAKVGRKNVDVLCVNCILNGYAVMCDGAEYPSEVMREMIEFFSNTRAEGVEVDIVSYNTVFKALVVLPEQSGAFLVFQRMMKELDSTRRLEKDVTTYTLMINMYRRYDCVEKCMELVREAVDKQVECDSKFFMAALNCCRLKSAREDVEQVLAWMREWKVPVIILHFSCALESFAAVGEFTAARELLNVMAESGVLLSTEHYNYALQACKKAENPQVLLDIVEEMTRQNLALDQCSYTSIILTLQREDNWAEAIKYLMQMTRLNIPPSDEVKSSPLGKYYFDRLSSN